MATLQTFLRYPRYLRAIPSLVVLTTAMAWSVLPDPDMQDATEGRARVSVVEGKGEAVVLLGVRAKME